MLCIFVGMTSFLPDSKLWNFFTSGELIKSPQNFVQGSFFIKSLRLCQGSCFGLISSLSHLQKTIITSISYCTDDGFSQKAFTNKYTLFTFNLSFPIESSFNCKKFSRRIPKIYHQQEEKLSLKLQKSTSYVGEGWHSWFKKHIQFCYHV